MSPKAQELRVALIGCGGIARVHVKGWQAAEAAGGARLVAAADPDGARRAWLEGEIPGARTFPDLAALLSGAEVDALDICLPHHLHAEAIVAGAKAGLHMLCEKPLCRTLDELAEVEPAVQASPAVFAAAHNQLEWPAIQEARRVLHSGRLGRPLHLRSTECFPMPTGEGRRAPGGWRAERALAGGGELVDTGYHPTYRLLFLAGSPPAKVAAFGARFRLTDMQAEDTAEVLVGFEDGSLGNILTSWALPGDSAFEVACEDGHLRGGPATLTVRAGRGAPETRTFDPLDGFTAEVARFVRCVREGEAPLHGLAEAADVLRVILAAYRSMEEGAAVPVEPASSTPRP